MALTLIEDIIGNVFNEVGQEDVSHEASVFDQSEDFGRPAESVCGPNSNFCNVSIDSCQGDAQVTVSDSHNNRKNTQAISTSNHIFGLL